MQKKNSVDMVKYLAEKDYEHYQKNLSVHEDFLVKLHKISLDLHATFKSCFNPMKTEWTDEQWESVNLMYQSMFNELILHDADILRQRSNDALNHSRRMIEIAAFIHECSTTESISKALLAKSKESAKRWRHGTESSTKRRDAKSRFQAYPLVKEHFSELNSDLFKDYDFCSYFVHPSPNSILKNIDQKDGYVVSNLHDFDRSDNQNRNEIVANHARLIEIFHSLAKKWETSAFDTDKWNLLINEISTEVNGLLNEYGLTKEAGK